MRRLEAGPMHLVGFSTAIALRATLAEPGLIRSLTIIEPNVPVAVVVPALVALTLVVAIVWVGLHAYEISWWREARARTRALRVPPS